MRINIYVKPLCYALFWAMVNCKGPNLTEPLSDPGIIDHIEVKGALSAQIDREAGTIQIVLPESYIDDVVYIDLTLPNGVILNLHPMEPLNSKNQVGFEFKGKSPYNFVVISQNQPVSFSKSYKVFVEHQGPLTARLISPILLYPLSVDPYSYLTATFQINSGLGTIPERPDSNLKLLSKLRDTSDQSILNGQHDPHISTSSFRPTGGINRLSRFRLELAYGQKSFIFPLSPPLRRIALVANADYDRKFVPLPKQKEIELQGGYFQKESKYRVKLVNDLEQSETWIDASFRNPGALTFSIPEKVMDGDYLFNLYESDSLIVKSKYVVSNQVDQSGLGQVWTENLSCPSSTVFFKDPSKVNLSKGQLFYVNPFPLIYDDTKVGVDEHKKLPDLELKSGNQTFILPSKSFADNCYGDSGTLMYFAAYNIPDEIPSGAYEARLITDQVKSLPFWTYFNVK
jgi:hypothetical protein